MQFHTFFFFCFFLAEVFQTLHLLISLAIEQFSTKLGREEGGVWEGFLGGDGATPSSVSFGGALRMIDGASAKRAT